MFKLSKEVVISEFLPKIFILNALGATNISIFSSACTSGVTLYQGAPGSKFSKAPLVEVPKARVERRICTSFLWGPGHAHAKIFESRVYEMPSLGLWGEIIQNSDGQ